MKTYNVLFTGKQSLIGFSEQNNLDFDKKYLIRVHTSVNSVSEATSLISSITSVFPNSLIAGTSVNAVIMSGKVIAQACLLSITEFDSTAFTVRIFDMGQRTITEAAYDTLAMFSADFTKAAIVMFTSMLVEVNTYLTIIKENYPDIALTGGISGMITCHDFVQYVFDNSGVYKNAVMCVAFEGLHLKAYGNAMLGHEAIGDIYSITKVNGCEICEIEGIRAAVWIREFFGKTDNVPGSKELTSVMEDILLRFPIVFEGHSGANAFLRYIPQKDGIAAYQKLSDKTRFRIGYISSTTSILACRKICSELENESIESIFAYSCMLKKTYMNNCAEWELTPFVNTDLNGGFICGEIANVNGKNEFFNGTCSLLGISEKPAHINIDNSAFKKMENLKDDNKDILNYVLKMQSESIIKKNKILSQQIIRQENDSLGKIFFDEQSGLYDIAKFAFDNEGRRFNKICMISVEKGNVLRSYYGNTDFHMVMLENLRLISDFFGMEDFNYYLYNRHTIVVVADEKYDKKKFQKLVRTFFLQCGKFSVKSLNITCLNSVSAVIDEYDKLVEKAATTLLNGEHSGQRYNIYNDSTGPAMKISEQMRWVEIISDAISNNRIIPYFQPIYDNVQSRVTKFESLVRILGKDGEIYLPGSFLDIAKDFKLYNQISDQMISKVLNLFSKRKETVSINVSAYDINSGEMRKKIFERIDRLDNPENFIFEIVESEDLQDYEKVYDFVKTAEQYGVKIAIDDFGSGYSNLVEIAKLEPDFIKIDGEIVRKINASHIHKSIAETAVYMSDKLGIELIAEYVENHELQDTILDMNVRYSQGYLFSKPMPYEELDTYLRSFPNSGVVSL